MTEDKWEEAFTKDDRFFSRKYESPVVFDHMDGRLGIDSSESMPTHLVEAMDKARYKIHDPKGENIAKGKVAFASSNQVMGLLEPSHLLHPAAQCGL